MGKLLPLVILLPLRTNWHLRLAKGKKRNFFQNSFPGSLDWKLFHLFGLLEGFYLREIGFLLYSISSILKLQKGLDGPPELYQIGGFKLKAGK